MNLKISEEFKNKIPPLTEDEFKQLRDNIVADGEVYEPIVVWNGVIVDGHNRWKIIQEHPEIPYRVKEMDFSDKWAAFEWMYKKQLGRRNLTDEQRMMVIGKLYEARKNTEAFKGNQYTQRSGGAQNGHQLKTAEIIAHELGIGHNTVKRAEKFAQGVEAVRAVSPEAAEKILSGKANITKTEVQELAKAEPEKVKEAAEAIKENRPKKVTLPQYHDYHKGKTDDLPEPQIPTDPNWEPDFELDDLLEEARGVTGNFLKQIQRVMRENRKMVSENLAEVTTVLDEVINGIEKLKEEF